MSTIMASSAPGPSLDSDDSDDTQVGQEEVGEQIHRLAQRITRESSHHGLDSLFPQPADSTLDPKSPAFDAERWARAFLRTRQEAMAGHPPHQAGLAFRSLNVHGDTTLASYQPTIGNAPLMAMSRLASFAGRESSQRVAILHDAEGVLNSGEMLCVLGPPGSGCTTLLKTLALETRGFSVDSNSVLNYQGISPEAIWTRYQGEAIYTAEVDHHFPRLTVGETLYFAARARCPAGLTEYVHEYAQHTVDVVMAMLGIAHTRNTRVGNDYIRGVSGGERKRVSIAEAVLSFSPWQCWDNSTRGLDSANAIEFCRTLRTQSKVFGNSVAVAIYQAPEEAYNLFDKVIVLYEGRQIFFGPTHEAKAYFEGLGFLCPEQHTTPDFLTSMTSASERIVRPDWQGKPPPRSPDEFARAWKESQQRQQLLTRIAEFETEFPLHDARSEIFEAAQAVQKSRKQRPASPYLISPWAQLRLNLWRAWRLLLSDPWMTITMLVTNFFEALIIASIFYNLSASSSSIDKRNLLIFFVAVMNALGSLLEVLTLYEKRKIVEKHRRYALAHPSIEAISSMVMDMPYKLVNAVLVNTTIYFMCNLRREPGPFFFFFFLNLLATIVMSTMFRGLASLTKSLSQALAPGAIILLAVVMFSGFVIPQTYLDDWIGWLRWVNPVFYLMESLALNEFVGRQFPCDQLVPSGPGYSSLSSSRICSGEGAVAGASFIDGAAHLRVQYGFVDSHRWRNVGIVIALTVAFLVLHLVAAELIVSEQSKGEILVFPRRVLKKRSSRRHGGAADEETAEKEGDAALPPACNSTASSDSERNTEGNGITKQKSTFHWQNICYELDIKGERRTILDHVDGWVKPGTLTALMGVSGAGKTTLLDALASRITMGVVTGDALVDGKPRNSSFQRKTGYATQQDLHLSTATVREALTFSALLRQPAKYTKQEKLAYVQEVIALVDLQDCADAVVGVLGEGLNVEQRKRLTIGVELAARPELLLFLDEPTSGLDSQTSWAICDLMRKLTDSGQAILCTIHQPSAALFQRFDRLLLLAKGGRTVYFGEVGRGSATLVDYFQRNGAPPYKDGVNPAEYMLDVIGATARSKANSNVDWHEIWRSSPEYSVVQEELARLAASHVAQVPTRDGAAVADDDDNNIEQSSEFAASFGRQILLVAQRVFQQYWRDPSYILSKTVMTAGCALFIGLSQVNVEASERGLFNQMMSVFVFLIIFGQIIEQAMPMFVTQRTLYEARERPAKTYSWVAFLFGTMSAELAWNSLMAVLSFILFYFPLGLYRNAEASGAVHSRGVTMFLNMWIFFMFSTSFGFMAIAGIDTAEVAGGIVNLFFIMMFAFNGVLASAEALPRFWIFMYRVNPLTYVVEALTTTALAGATVTCRASELLRFDAPQGQMCGEYMAPYIAERGGYLAGGGDGGSSCSYCRTADAEAFLTGYGLRFDNCWRDFGLVWAYCVFNILGAVGMYWLFRVPKGRKDKA
ncbi:ABC transporter CDR4 [Microdochium bolleyi]|uniref:ABC transporter CDR4 n=1 Tax=Microdochium bolleyi TaxID=196109 RepID=A0A136IQT6_9PEZI|nr:ABC transporter CDR4 [Microdochium bolleyi]